MSNADDSMYELKTDCIRDEKVDLGMCVTEPKTMSCSPPSVTMLVTDRKYLNIPCKLILPAQKRQRINQVEVQPLSSLGLGHCQNGAAPRCQVLRIVEERSFCS